MRERIDRVMYANVRPVLIAICGASAGIHLGLTLAHADEPRYSFAYFAAAVLLVGVAALLFARPEDSRVAGLAALLFAGLIVSWVLFRHEPMDVTQVFAKGIETVGLVLALRAVQARFPQVAASTSLTAFGLALAAGLMLGAGHHG